MHFQIKPEYPLCDKINKENAVFHYHQINIMRTGETAMFFFYDAMSDFSYL